MRSSGIPAQRHLQEQFTEQTALRRYLTIVHGHARHTVNYSLLAPDWGDGLRGSMRASTFDACQAVTLMAVVKRLRGAILVSCRLATGRTHQIRTQLTEAGHPLLGETVYVRDFQGP